jgi:hypothetical protein
MLVFVGGNSHMAGTLSLEVESFHKMNRPNVTHNPHI